MRFRFGFPFDSTFDPWSLSCTNRLCLPFYFWVFAVTVRISILVFIPYNIHGVVVNNRTGDLRVPRAESSSIAVGDDRDKDPDLDSGLWLDVYLSSPPTLFFVSRSSYEQCPQKIFNSLSCRHVFPGWSESPKGGGTDS